MRNLLLFLAVLSLSLPALAQQTGDLNRDYSINGNGAGGTSPVLDTVFAPGGFSNLYTTQDPGAPIFVLAADAIIPGFTITPTNSIDLDLHTLNILVDGTAPGFPSPFVTTNLAGTFSISGSLNGTPAGTSTALAMAHVAASSPDGWWFSQSHMVDFVGPFTCAFPGTNINAGDDSPINMPLGFTYTYYGTAYTDLFVGPNGFITFGAGSSDFSESVTDLLNGPPRIAIYWRDLSPNVAGSVNFFTDNAGVAEVCFLGVPEFGGIGTNSFNCILDNTAGTITGSYDTFMTATQGLVGVSPGGGLDPVGLPVDLTLGPNAIPAGMAAFELFDLSNPNDLPGSTLTWTVDATGNPISQN